MPTRMQRTALTLVGLFAGLLFYYRNRTPEARVVGLFIAIAVGIVVYNLILARSPRLTEINARMMNRLQKAALIILAILFIASPIPLLISGEDFGVVLILIAPVLFLAFILMFFYFWSAFLIRFGRVDLAVQHQSNLLRLRPKSFLNYRLRAALLQMRGDYSAALQDMTAALRATPNHPLLLLERAALYNALALFPQAIADCDRAQHVLTQYASGTYKGSPFVAQNTGSGEKLIIRDLTAFKTLIHLSRATSFYLMDDYERAAEDLDTALVSDSPKHAPLKPTLLLVRAMVYHEQGEPDEANRIWGQVISQEPRFTDHSWVMEGYKASPHMAERVQAFLTAMASST